MQKFPAAPQQGSTLPRDAELQLRLADSGGAGEGKENGAGKHFPGQARLEEDEQRSICTKRRMLVGLDLLCLFVGKNLTRVPDLFLWRDQSWETRDSLCLGVLIINF